MIKIIQYSQHGFVFLHMTHSYTMYVVLMSLKKINSCAIRTTVNTVMSICLKVSQMLFKCKSHNIRTTIEIDFTR